MSNREMPAAPKEEAGEKPAPQVDAVPAKEPARLIDVVALRDGFYDGQRMSPGQQFQVLNFEQVGLWMKCLDPKIEGKRVKPKHEAAKVIPRAGK